MAWRDRPLLILAGLAVVAALGIAAAVEPQDLVLYNHSPSVPPGLYVRSGAPIAVGAFVTVRASDVAPEEARRRRFEGPTDRFIKRVAATGGARVCGDGRRLTVDDIVVVGAVGDRDDGGDEDRHAVAVPLHHDDANDDRVGWRGCRVLADNELLLLGDTADSFDGRYWGPVSTRSVEGVWRRL